MNYKKITLVALIVAGLFVANPVNAAPKKATSVPVTNNYPQIEHLIENNQYSVADNMINTIIKKSPNDVKAQALSIISSAKQNNLDLAQKKLDYYIAKYPNNADLHYAQGIILLKRQASSDMNFREISEDIIISAKKEFNKAISLNPKHYQAYNACGVIAISNGDFDKAKGYFNKALLYYPTYSTAMDNAGTVEFLTGNFDTALKYYNDALKYNPRNSTAFYHIGQIYDKKALYTEALDAIDTSLAIKRSSVAYNLMGEIYTKQGNEAAAINAFKNASSIKPENPKPYMNLASIYEKRSDNSFAIEQLKTAVSTNPNNYTLKLKIADISYKNNDYPQALKYYSSLVGIKGYNNVALKGLAATYFEQSKDLAVEGKVFSHKDLLRAYTQINEAIKCNPNDLELYLAKLKLAKLSSQPCVTNETLLKIIDTPATGISDIIAKGDAYLAMNKYKEARIIFEEALSYANTIDEKLYIAEILTYEKYYNGAKVILKDILKEDMTNKDARIALNYIYNCEQKSNYYYRDAKYFQRHGNQVFAREYAKKAMTANPNNINVAILSAKLFEQQKHYSEAIDSYKVVAALLENPQDVQRVYRKIAKLEKTINDLNQKNEKKENKQLTIEHKEVILESL